MGEWKTIGHKGHGFKAVRDIVQSIPTGVHTVILFNTENFDTNNEYNPADGKFTPQEAGYYVVSGNVTIQDLTDGNIYVIRIMKNGGSVAVDRGISGGNDRCGGCASLVIDMNGSTDYLQVSFRHDRGSSLNTEPGGGYCSFSGWILSPP